VSNGDSFNGSGGSTDTSGNLCLSTISDSMLDYFGGMLRLEQAERRRLEAELLEEKAVTLRLRVELRDRQRQAEEQIQRLQRRLRDRERQAEQQRSQLLSQIEQEREASQIEHERLRERARQYALCQKSLLREVSSLLMEREALKKELLGTTRYFQQAGHSQAHGRLASVGSKPFSGAAEYVSVTAAPREVGAFAADSGRAGAVIAATGNHMSCAFAGGSVLPLDRRCGRRAVSQPPVARRLFEAELGDAAFPSDAGAVVTYSQPAPHGVSEVEDEEEEEREEKDEEEKEQRCAAREWPIWAGSPPEAAPADCASPHHAVLSESSEACLPRQRKSTSEPPIHMTVDAPSMARPAAVALMSGSTVAGEVALSSVGDPSTDYIMAVGLPVADESKSAYVRHMQAFARRMRRAKDQPSAQLLLNDIPGIAE